MLGDKASFSHYPGKPGKIHFPLRRPPPDFERLTIGITIAKKQQQCFVQLLRLRAGGTCMIFSTGFPHAISRLAHTNFPGHILLTEVRDPPPLGRLSLSHATALRRQVHRPLDGTSNPAHVHTLVHSISQP
jgi:hypothetical protein